jgi:Na+(H+)/acetate symporter ActP
MILMIGVLVFVYYLFSAPPLLYNTDHELAVEEQAPAEYTALRQQYDDAFQARRQAAIDLASARDAGDKAAAQRMADEFLADNQQLEGVRDDALALAERTTGENPRDVNYIIPSFVLGELPIIIPGLFIAAVLAAAMSSIAAELNSLSTATVIDFYRRRFKPDASDAHYLLVSKLATGFWGLFAMLIALWAVALGSLIEVVNRFGSFFYGSILGVFILAFIPRARGRGAFFGLIAGMTTVGAVSFFAPDVSFLWYNVIGAVAVLAVGFPLSLTAPDDDGEAASSAA